MSYVYRSLLTAILTISCFAGAAAQELDLEKSVLFLCGIADIEELDAEVMERYQHLAAHPVEINAASSARLQECGLFTRFQVASLAAYRSESGDVLSSAELALIDGFSAELADALTPFVSFMSNLPAGALKVNSLPALDLEARTSALDWKWDGGVKADLLLGSWSEFAVACKWLRAAPLFPPSSTTFSAAYYGRRHVDKIVVGDFNARFGQGLCLWTGFSMSGVSGIQSFARRPTGISVSRSYSANNLRGAAAVLSFGRFTISPVLAVKGLRSCMEGNPAEMYLMTGGDAAWYCRYGQVDLTGWWLAEGDSRLSASARFCVQGVDIWGEAAYMPHNRVFGGVGGVSVPMLDGNVVAAVSARYYPIGISSDYSGALRYSTKASDECGLSAGLQFFKAVITADLARRLSSGNGQLKLLASRDWTLTEHIMLKTRMSLRFRNYGQPSRADLRADCCAAYGRWLTNARANGVMCDKFGLLGYIEEGYKSGRMTLWLRGTIFMADKWDDRIYVYERDAVGSFNVPAYYGRGFSISALACRTIYFGRQRLKLWARASWTSKPWNTDEKKPDKIGLKFQLDYDF